MNMSASNIVAPTFTIRGDAKSLKRALDTAISVTERRNTILVVGMVLMFEKDGRLWFRGTDLDFEISASCEAETTGMINTCIDGRSVSKFLVGVTGAVDLRFENGILSVTADHMTMRLRDLHLAEDFPKFVLPGTKEGFVTTVINGEVFSAALAKVRHCISTEETRYYLNGVWVHAINGNLCTVATDGHRLGKYDARETWPLPGMILPAKAVYLLGALIGKGNASLTIGGNGLRFSVTPEDGDWSISGKAIDGTFPDYTRVIPTINDKFEAIVSRHALQRMLRIAVNESARAIKLSPDEGTMSYRIPGGIEADAFISGSGEAERVNGRYLMAAMMGHDEIRLQSGGKGNPMLAHTSDPDLTQVIMPMRV